FQLEWLEFCFQIKVSRVDNHVEYAPVKLLSVQISEDFQLLGEEVSNTQFPDCFLFPCRFYLSQLIIGEAKEWACQCLQTRPFGADFVLRFLQSRLPLLDQIKSHRLGNE